MEFSLLHDLHCHSHLSSCAKDERMTADNIFQHAKDKGYTTQCITDHLWDKKVPGASKWYEPQDILHVQKSLPFSDFSPVRTLFGCETEYIGHGVLGLHRAHFDLFDFVVIPVNHTHMKGFVRPDDVNSEEKMAHLMVERLEELTKMDLPFEKVGIAHLTGTLMYKEGDVKKIFRLMDETRLMKVFDFFAKKGAGIELNASSFPDFELDKDAWLRLYRMAKKAGCTFYAASDAHSIEALDDIQKYLPAVVSNLGLTDKEQYLVP